MNTDSYFEIGSVHQICQDYAFSGSSLDGIYSYAAISDGCSASGKSHPVDVGARLLVHSYISKLFMNKGNLFPDDSLINFSLQTRESYIRHILYSIAEFAVQDAHHQIFGFDKQVLDCTLVSLISNGKCLYYSICGDGCVVILGRKAATVIDVEFPSGAPFYLSYTMDDDRRKRYTEEFGNKKIVTTKTYDLDTGEEIESIYAEVAFDNKITGVLFGDGCPVAAIAISDGYKTFNNESERVSTKEEEVLKNIYSYKNFNGEFVKRRMLSYKKRCHNDGVVHYDDLSVAAIYFGE